MTEVWSGDILLADGNAIKDVGLTSQNVESSSSPAFTSTTLRFLTTVDTARIPLYLATGPSLDVWTTCEATEAWFEAILLSKAIECDNATSSGHGHGWCSMARSQSPIGILAQVQSAGQQARQPRVTEILFYGTIAVPSARTLPTPPSSSPEHHDAQTHSLPELRVHALPLSSDLLYQQHDPVGAEPRFLPAQLHGQAPDSPKRKRDIFQEATIAGKKARGKGGVGIAAAAARAGDSQPPSGHGKTMSIDTKSPPGPDARPPSAHGALSRPASRRLSRSPSVSSEARPPSRKGLLDGHNKRSNLSQVATVSHHSDEPTTESRNKEALSRVVMAAMRMHGLQQRKKHTSHRTSGTRDAEDGQHRGADTYTEEAAKDEEYKLMYHQTYRAAAFAFRKHIVEKPLHAQPDRLRDVVEKLLTLFLNDPLTQTLLATGTTSAITTPGSKPRPHIPGSSHSHASPFDMPSAARSGVSRSQADKYVNTGSPVSRRKNNKLEMDSM